MSIKGISSFKIGLSLFFCGMSFFAFGQNTNAEKKQIQDVFDQLVLAYGSAKPAPQLIVEYDKPKKMKPAEYSPYLKADRSIPKPNIKIDAYLYTICRTFGKDSLNALSIVLSHELAHYYSDHTFCLDYAFAIMDKNKTMAQGIAKANLSTSLLKETEADDKGFFYATVAGYSPFNNLQANLIARIYKEYGLPDEQAGYPTKQERIEIAKSAEERAQFLYRYFKAGLKAMEEKKYDEAITAFGNANGYIPYRENYNNMGVAKVLKALPLKVKTSEENCFPDRFLYPLEIENKSRLAQETTRGMDDNQDQMEKLLKDAQKDFEKAISLDPNFTKGFINLACVYDLLDNPEGAIGTIKRLTTEKQKSRDAQRILAIAYYHADNEKKAEEIWKELEK